MEEGNNYGKEAADMYGVTALPAICKKNAFTDWYYNDECRMAVSALSHLELREMVNEVRDLMAEMDAKRTK
jgi:hypothetical protein